MNRHVWAFLLAGGVCFCTPAADADQFKCGGTEPFWDLQISESEMQLRDMSGDSFDKVIKLVPTPAERARGTAEDFVRVYRTKIAGQDNEPVTVVLQKSDSSECSDDMSEKQYAYYAIVITRQFVLRGCCEKK